MAEPISLTRRQIDARAADKVYVRGEALYETGAITSPSRRGNEISARCRGSAAAPYRVWAQFKNAKVEAASCDCPYDWGGDCKHIVAMLLAYMREPNQFEPRKTLREELESREKTDLLDIIEDMITRYPDLEEIVARAPAAGAAKTVIDLRAIQLEMRSALVNRGQWMDRTAENKIYELASLGERHARRGQPIQALSIYCAILNECNAAHYPTDDEGQYSEAIDHTVEELGEALAQVDIADHENLREQLLDMLVGAVIWDIEFGGIGYADDAEELLQGIVKPADTRAIRERIRLAEERDREGGYADLWSADAFEYFLMRLDTVDSTPPEATLARLKAKERHVLYAGLLLKLERHEEAVAAIASLQPVHKLRGGLALLVKHQQVDQAIQLAEAELDREHDNLLAAWLINLYKQQGDDKAEFRWLLNRLRRDPCIENYIELRAAAASNETWLETRSTILNELEQDEACDVLALIYLRDEEWDLAWDFLEKAWQLPDRFSPYTLNSLAFSVAEASGHARPANAIPVYVHHARGRIGGKSRKAYAGAAELLQEVRWMYQQRGDIPGWEALIADFRAEFARMPALQDELNKAGL